MGQDCLWNSEEPHREWTAQLICTSLLYGTRLPLGQREAAQRMDWTADLLLVYVWDEAASGSAKSNTEDILHSWSAPCLCMEQDCFWNREEHNVGDINPLECGSILNQFFNLSLCRSPGTGQIRSPKGCSSLFQRQSCPRIKGGADQLWSLISVLLLAVLEAVLSHKEAD